MTLHLNDSGEKIGKDNHLNTANLMSCPRDVKGIVTESE